MSTFRPVAKKFFLTVVFTALIVFCACTKEQHNEQKTVSSSKNDVVTLSQVLATLADNEKPDSASDHESNQAPEKHPAEIVIEMNKYGKGVAYIAKIGDQVCVVHNGKRGKLYDKIESFTLKVSPDGQRVAYGAQIGDRSYVVVDGVEKGPFSDRGKISFSPDSQHVAYYAQIGDLWYMYADNVKNVGGLLYFDAPVFSGDSKKISYIETSNISGEYRLIISDLKFKRNITIPITDPLVVINPGKTTVAAVQKRQDKKQVIMFDFNHPDEIKSGELFDEIKQLTFSGDGTALAYIAVKDGQSYVMLNDRREMLPSGDYPWPFVVRPDNKGVGIFIVIADGKSAYLHDAFSPGGKKNKVYKEGAHLTYTKDGKHYAYVAIQNEKFTIVVDGKEGPFFERAITPHFSPNGKFLVYRARQDNKRFVVIADVGGKIVKRLPVYERIFDTTFTEDGKSVAYGVKDGNQIMWKVESL